MLLALYVEKHRTRLEVSPLCLYRQVGHFGELMIVAVVDVNVKDNGQRCGTTQFAFSQTNGQILHLTVKGQHAQRTTIHVECPSHDGCLDLRRFMTLQYETVELLVFAVHLLDGDVVIALEIFDT